MLPSASVAPPDSGLPQVLGLVTASDTCRGMFFNGVFDAARSLGGPEVEAMCLAAVGQTRFVDFFSYPVADFLKAIYVAAEVLGPSQGGPDAVLRYLGRRGTGDFLKSNVGRTMLALSGTEPRGLLESLPRSFRAAASYGERSVAWLGDNQALMSARRDFLPPAYNEGVLLAVLELASVSQPVVRIRRLGPLDADYELSWS